MGRLWTVIIALFVSGCASGPIISSNLLIKNAREDLKSATDMSLEAKKTYQQYVGAHKHMIQSKSIQDRQKVQDLNQSMLKIRESAKSIFALRSKIKKDVVHLEKVLNKTASVSQGSEIYPKIAPQVELYGHGKPHPELEPVKKAYDESVKEYTSKVSGYSGYITDATMLKSQFQQKVTTINQRLNQLIAKAGDEKAFVDVIGQMKLQISDLESKFASELPEKSKKVFLFPTMISYSIMDRLTAISDQLIEVQKKIP